MQQNAVDPAAQDLTWGVGELAAIFKKSPNTILQDHSRSPDRLPPAITPPGVRPVWLKETVLDWLREQQERAGAARQAAPRVRTEPKAHLPRRGASTKAERVEAARLGVTVAELRRREEGGE